LGNFDVFKGFSPEENMVDGSPMIQTKQDQGSNKKKLTNGQWVASTTSRCFPQHQAKNGTVT
jgi:hypothetical protein